MRTISNRLYYVGVNDRSTHRFEAMWPIPCGVSYNSYLIKGSQKTALIDAVEIGELHDLRQNLVEIIGRDAPDYLVINHMEPDHSGALPALADAFKSMMFVGNAKTIDMMQSYYGIPRDRIIEVKDGDEIDLGDLKIRFYLTPMLHWPETMMTYCEGLKTLFSGDAFGCFGALAGAVVDNDMDVTRYFSEMERYYASIVGKYGAFVQRALAKLSSLDIDYICPTHGPVWHDEIKRVIDIYDRFSRYEGRTGVTIIYGSMYGHTGRMADEIAEQLSRRGVREIRIHNAATTDLSYILADVFRYKGLIVGGPTYSNGLFPPVENVLRAIGVREVKNRVIGAFGSCSWAPLGLKRVQALLDEAKLLSDDIVTASAKGHPDSASLAQCRAIADAVADKLL